MVSPTAVHTRYRNAKGIVVPGVTTVIALLAKPALIPWAWKLGMAGEDMNKVRDKAADIGTCVHYLCECFLKGQNPELQHFTGDTIAKAKPLSAKFQDWFTKEDLTMVASECNLVSEKWQFGGCVDLVAMTVDKRRGLYDIKTSKGVYDEYRIQLSAYEEAWDELHPDEPIDFIKVVHLDKESGGLNLYDFEHLHTEFEIFKHLRAIYVLQKKTDPNRDKAQSKGYRNYGRTNND